MAGKRISFRVAGKVQGVHFRSYTQKQAGRIGVTGYVTNASDGSVQGEAQGSDDQIKQFVQRLHTGPSASSVSGVDTSDISTAADERSFDVKY